MVFVHNRHRGIAFDHPGRDRTSLAGDNPNILRIIRIKFHHEALDVQNDVRHIFHHALQTAELMFSTLQLDVSDCRAFKAAEQDTAEAVAYRRAKPALKRLSRESAVCIRRKLQIADHPRRQF